MAGLWAKLGRWLGGGDDPRDRRARPHVTRPEPIYERTPRPVVALVWEPPRERAPAALLHVDDAGAHRLVSATRLVVGRAACAEADLRVPGEGADACCGLVLRTSLRGGASWVVVPLAEEGVLVDGVPLAGPTTLGDGDRVDLGGGAVLRVHAPDPGSSAWLLELPEGREDFGARRAILQPPGASGRVRIGPGPRCLVRVEGLEQELELVGAEGRLELRSEAGVQAARGGSTERAPSIELAFPPTSLTPVDVGGAREARPPFGVALAPLERAPVAGPAAPRP